MKECFYDVAVVGAGVAGCATAIALTANGYKTIIMERRRRIEDRPGETVSALVRQPLEALQLWTTFEASEPRPCYATTSAWGGPEFNTRSSMIDPLGPGWHIDRRRFDTALWTKVRKSGIALIAGVPDFRLQRSDEWRISWPVERIGGRDGPSAAVRARFLVDASGRGRAVARRLGHRARRYDRLVGWMGYVSRSDEQEAATTVQAAPDGWWYSAPLPSGRAVVTYMTDSDLSSRERLLCSLVANAEYSDTLQRLGVTRDLWNPQPFAAATGNILHASGEGWIAVGDASATYDPISAQGIQMALVSGLRGAEAIAAWLNGSSAECAKYLLMQRLKFDDYLAKRTQYYRMEQRWRDRPFWMRRQRSE